VLLELTSFINFPVIAMILDFRVRSERYVNRGSVDIFLPQGMPGSLVVVFVLPPIQC